jgi:LuxR family transcriptional regulator, maltose regulon positive regulatory protein
MVQAPDTTSAVPAPRVPELPHQHITRPRLHQRLAEAVDEAKVIQMTGPAASGKTTLLGGWYASGTAPTMAYLTLEALDDDLRRFWVRVVGALRLLHPSWRTGSLAELSPPDTTSSFLDSLLTEVRALDPTVVVLDAIDHLRDPELTATLGAFIRDMPGTLTVVLVGRTDPPLRQSLLRARGHLVDIHASELAFTADEVSAYVSQFGDLDITAADAQALHHRTEGWVGGVKLATMAVAKSSSPAESLRALTGTNRYVADLLEEEVLEPQPIDVQDFLLSTSVLEVMDDGLCNAVSGERSSGVRLEQLLRLGLFVSRVDPAEPAPTIQPLREPDWGRSGMSTFRYTPLFREFLQHELRVRDPWRAKLAHRAAASAYEGRGEIGTAIRQYVVAEEPREAVRLVVEHGERFAATGHVETLRGWLASWPEHFLADDPEEKLAVARLCVIAGMRDDAATWLGRARKRIEASGDVTLLAEHTLLTGLFYATLGNVEAAVAEGHRVLSTVGPDDDATRVIRWKAHNLLAGAYATIDEFERARRHRDLAPPDEDAEISTEAYSAWLDYREGYLDRAVEHANTLLAGSSLPWQWGLPLIARGAVRRERHEVAEAELDLTRARELAEQWSRPRQIVLGAIELGLLYFAQGRTVDAFDILAEARPHAHGSALRQRVEATVAGLWLREGDVERCVGLRRDIPDGRWTAALDVRIAMAHGDRVGADARLAALAEGRRSLQDHIVYLLLDARLRVEADDGVAAADLTKAVELGRPEGFVQTFVDDLPALERLLRSQVADHDDSYASELLAAVAPPPGGLTTRPSLVEPLSEREAVVLRYLQTRLSNKEIARELHMSVNTLKTHLKSIYRKLGVGTRAEAVISGRRQHLL